MDTDLRPSSTEAAAGSARPPLVSRRTEQRFATECPAVMTMLQGEPDFSCSVAIIDLSASGLGLNSPIYVEPGATVQVVMKSTRFEGTVRWCRERLVDDTYRIGLKILGTEPVELSEFPVNSIDRHETVMGSR